VPLDDISPHMINATVSTEDNSFWDNPGVNITGLARAAYENYVGGEFGSGTGGSSITQQLIKNVYICPSIGDEASKCVAERTLKRKLKEIAYALELEQDYSKEEILQLYLNQISYADRYIGVQAAADGYFRKPAKDLTLAEAAALAGVPQFPTRYHPRLNCVRDDAGQCVLDELG
jgi:membrane peptidoglycan carboxypeptidase